MYAIQMPHIIVTIKKGKQTMRDTIITTDDLKIIDEEEILEELYDEIKDLLESLYDLNISILYNQHEIINDS